MSLFDTCPCTTTDDDGYYRLPDIFVGVLWTMLGVRVWASKVGYWTLIVAPVEVRANQTTTQDLQILRVRFARVGGVVRDAITHEPLQDVSVGADSGVGDQTDGAGQYLIEGVSLADRNAPRDTTVYVQPDLSKYSPASAVVPIRADETSTKDFDLLPICDDATISGAY